MWFAALIGALFLALAQPAAAQRPADAEVDLLLVLGADVSRSVDDREFRLQREGYAAGLTHPKVIDAIQSGGNGRIAVIYYEWSGTLAQRVIIDWTVISNLADAQRFAAKLQIEPRAYMDRTAIGAAIEYGMAQLQRSPYQAPRRVIDISGDGTNTNGTLPSTARDAAVEAGVTINGLVILSPEPLPWNPAHTHPPGGLENYFIENVIGGPGAFTMVAESFDTFNRAILQKLIREIALAPQDREIARN
jgi:hypothetical protein